LFKLIASIAGGLVLAYLLGVRHEFGTTTEQTFFGPVDVLTRITQVNLLPTIVGAVAGGVAGYFASILVLYALGRRSGGLGAERRKGAGQKHTYSNKTKEAREYNAGKNLVLFAGFLGVALLVWLFLFAIAILVLWEHLANKQQAVWVLKGFALLSLVIAWVIIGRKIVLKEAWRRRLDRLLCGPFTRIRVAWPNRRQQKTIWIGILVEAIVWLFPPWVAYLSLCDGQPDGKSEFIGFHFFALSEYGVLGETAYIAARISYELLGWISLGVGAVCAILLLIYRHPKPYQVPR